MSVFYEWHGFRRLSTSVVSIPVLFVASAMGTGT